MRPLLVSGLLCIPALVMLSFGWPNDEGMHVRDVTVISAQAAPVTQPPVITILLPPTQFQAELPQANPSASTLAWDEGLTAAPMPPEPTQPSPKRVLHARAPTPRPASSVIVAQTAFQEQPYAVWARMVHWLTQHEAPKIWSPGGGEGAG